jgi:hypothetical protein
MKTLQERLDLIKPKILSPRFLSGKGLGNEINFWIFDYDPRDELEVRSHIDYLRDSVASERDDVRIRIFDLFDMMVEYLDEKGYLDKTLKMEHTKGSAAIASPIKRTLRSTEPDDVIVSRIAADSRPGDILFLRGVGKAWPVIRSHTVLNNLHSRVESTPLVMFFPGVYDSELRLFGDISDDNYYRAFHLVER